MFENQLYIKRFEELADWQNVQESLLQKIENAASSKVEKEFFYCGLVVFNASESAISACIVYHNPDLNWANNAAGCFGNFDSVNHPEAAELLLRTAGEILRQLGKSTILGPMNGSTWSEYRLAVDGFHFNYLLDLKHPAYYPDLIRRAGFDKIGRYVTHLDDALICLEERFQRAQERLLPMNLHYRNMDLDHYDAELDKIYAFCMFSFADNLLFTPISRESFKAKYLPLKAFIRPEYVLFCTSASGEVQGLLFAVPNLLDTQRKGMIIKTIARNPGEKLAGLATILACMLYQRMAVEGFQYALHAFMEEHNYSVKLSHHFSGIIVKQYELYALTLNP